MSHPTPKTREEAIERLAEELQFQMEHLEPIGEIWEDLDQPSREFFRKCVRWLLVHHDIIDVALERSK